MSKKQENKHLDVHVALCAERYKLLNMRLDRIEKVLWWLLSTMMLAMAGIIFELLLNGRLI